MVVTLQYLALACFTLLQEKQPHLINGGKKVSPHQQQGRGPQPLLPTATRQSPSVCFTTPRMEWTPRWYLYIFNQFTTLSSKRGAGEQRSTFRYKRCHKISSCFAQFVLHNFFSFMKLNQVSCLLFMCNH